MPDCWKLRAASVTYAKGPQEKRGHYQWIMIIPVAPAIRRVANVSEVSYAEVAITRFSAIYGIR